MYSLWLVVCGAALHLWLGHYLAVQPDLAYALPTFLSSLAVSTACLAALALSCIVTRRGPAPLNYLVSLATAVNASTGFQFDI